MAYEEDGWKAICELRGYNLHGKGKTMFCLTVFFNWTSVYPSLNYRYHMVSGVKISVGRLDNIQ